MNAPFKLPTLADKALLVRLQRSMYQPYAYDDSATKTIEQMTGVKNAGRYNKRLFKDNRDLAETNEAFSVLYNTYRKNTVPWLDDGVRMVPNAIYFEFAHEMRGLIQAAKSSVQTLAQKWDSMVLADMQRLGPLANPKDYISKDDLLAKFDATIHFFPIPSTSDFRVEVTDEDKAEMEKALKEAETNVSKYLLGEMLDPVKAFVEKLSIPIGEKGAVFRNSLVENLVDVVDRLPRLNINGDPAVAETINQIKAIVDTYGENPDVLRESPIVRQQARDKMAEIDAKLAAFMGG